MATKPSSKKSTPAKGTALKLTDEHTSATKKYKDAAIAVEPTTQVIAKLPLGKDMALISITEYRDVKALDIRRYYLSDQTNEWCPTSKGIRVDASLAPTFLEVLELQGEAITKALS